MLILKSASRSLKLILICLENIFSLYINYYLLFEKKDEDLNSEPEL